jgi:anthranilate phosphoribosyltransferase
MSAAALYTYGVVPSIKAGVDRAYSVLASGKALDKLDQWIAFSHTQAMAHTAADS